MKKWIIGMVAVAGVATMLCGCGGDKTSQTTPAGKDITQKVGQDSFVLLPSNTPGESNDAIVGEGNAQEEAGIRYELAASLPFEEGDDKICAIAYMGDTGAETEENLTAFYAKYFPNISSDSWDILPEIDCGGGQCYLVIPRYKDAVAYVNTMETTLDGQIQVATSEVVKEEAFLVYCNVSPDFPNSEVHFLYGEKHLVVVPRLDEKSGHVEPVQVALDLTMKQAYE